MLILMTAPEGAWLAEGAVGYRKRVIARHTGRRQAWRPIVAKADVILPPSGRPAPAGCGLPDGVDGHGSP
jgi:hypothetical protein